MVAIGGGGHWCWPLVLATGGGDAGLGLGLGSMPCVVILGGHIASGLGRLTMLIYNKSNNMLCT